ncbi:MAG: helix-turn-helix transcriptional regulator [Proteobacteria bacterium]|nr:helix-turn-helix transcriptional regulator [Pseudomonadota bacterium]
MSGTHYPQFCALARAAEILGERWTLLIIRELLVGQKRFSDLSDRLGALSPTVLTTRLNMLVEQGVVQRSTLPPPFNAQVYKLTPVGLALKPAIYELIRWGGHFLFPMRPDDEFDPEWVLLGLDAVARRAPTPARKILLHVLHNAKSASFLVTGGPNGTTIAKIDDSPGGAAIETTFDTLLRIIATDISIETAVSERLARIEGSINIVRSLPKLFDLRRSSARR